MRKRSRVIHTGSGILRNAMLAGMVLAGAAIAATVASVAVKVKQTSVRSDHQFFAPTLATARFTEQLEVLGQEQGWYRVRYGGVTGWVHSSAVSEGGQGSGSTSGAFSGLGSALSALSGRPSQTASTTRGYTDDEVALAGKGFNRNVEEQYRSRYPRADFAAVDKLERLQANADDIGRFARAGQLLNAGQVLTAPQATGQARESQGGGPVWGFVSKGSSPAPRGPAGAQHRSQEADPWGN
jgi:hypothetical protein